MLATVAICTRNRAALLGRCFDALAAMRMPAGVEWEVLVVDNASTDDTPVVVHAWADRLPLRRVLEMEPGIAAARNRAVSESLGEYILWLDDDALVAHEWLASYVAAFRRWPDDAVLGGPIDVRFEAELPEWFARVFPRVAGVYGERDLGPEHAPLVASSNRIPFGANYVTRRAEQARFLYDTELGRHPDHPARGSEETDVILRMLGSGMTGRWVPGARVVHLKGSDRLSLEFIAGHLASYGEYSARRHPPGGLRVAGAPFRAWTRAVRWSLRYAIDRRFAPPERWIESLIQSSEARGALRGHRKASRETPGPDPA